MTEKCSTTLSVIAATITFFTAYSSFAQETVTPFAWHSASSSPTFIPFGEMSTTRFRVEAITSGVQPKQVTLFYRYHEYPYDNPYEMCDDGPSGNCSDEVADDGTWSLEFEPGGTEPNELRFFNGTTDEFTFNIRAFDDTGNSLNTVFLSSGVYKSTKPTSVVEIATGLHVSDTVLNVVDPGLTEENTGVERAAQLICDTYGPIFDFFVFFLHDRYLVQPFPIHYRSHSNDATGIGEKGLQNPNPSYGCGELRGIAWLNRSSPVLHSLPHEMFHQYSAYIRGSPDLALSHGAHWKPSTMDGQLMTLAYGLEDIGSGLMTVELGGHSNHRASWLDLYLAGLVPKEEVPDNWWIIDPDVIDSGFGTVISYDQARNITIQDIIDVEGPRLPAFGDAKTDFRVGFVVVSDEPLDAFSAEFYTRLARYFEGSSPGGVLDDGSKFPGGLSWHARSKATYTFTLPNFDIIFADDFE